MVKTSKMAFAVAVWVVVITGSAQAGSITIVNNSFEAPGLAPGSGQFTTTNGVSGGIPAPSIPGWTLSSAVGNIGVYAAPGFAYTPPDGAQVGYIGGGDPQIVDPGSFSQVLGVSPVAGATYDLSVYVGARGEGYPVGDYSITLLAGSTVLASVTDPVAPAPGTFDLTGLSYTATSSDASLGNLEIVLSGGSSADGTAYGQVAFDDVTLTTAVPEASTWAMMLLGFGGVAAAVRRRAGALAA